MAGSRSTMLLKRRSSTGSEAVLLVVEVGGGGLVAKVLGAYGLGVVRGQIGAGTEAGDLAPGVAFAGLGHPEGQAEAEVVGDGCGLGLVHVAELEEAGGGPLVTADIDVSGAEEAAEAAEVLRREAVWGEVVRRLDPGVEVEDVAKIDEGVASHREGELGLAGRDALAGFRELGGYEEGAGVEDGDEGGEPALVVVLRPVIAEDGVGDVALEDLGGPAFPLGEELDEDEVAAFEAVAGEELGGSGG
jgi:hypothetical protein